MTVTRSEDPVLAPNDHVLHFDSASAARRNIADPGVDGSHADVSHSWIVLLLMKFRESVCK